jgi:hypothetical protein
MSGCRLRPSRPLLLRALWGLRPAVVSSKQKWSASVAAGSAGAGSAVVGWGSVGAVVGSDCGSGLQPRSSLPLALGSCGGICGCVWVYRGIGTCCVVFGCFSSVGKGWVVMGVYAGRGGRGRHRLAGSVRQSSGVVGVRAAAVVGLTVAAGGLLSAGQALAAGGVAAQGAPVALQAGAAGAQPGPEPGAPVPAGVGMPVQGVSEQDRAALAKLTPQERELLKLFKGLHTTHLHRLHVQWTSRQAGVPTMPTLHDRGQRGRPPTQHARLGSASPPAVLSRPLVGA